MEIKMFVKSVDFTDDGRKVYVCLEFYIDKMDSPYGTVLLKSDAFEDNDIYCKLDILDTSFLENLLRVNDSKIRKLGDFIKMYYEIFSTKVEETIFCSFSSETLEIKSIERYL